VVPVRLAETPGRSGWPVARTPKPYLVVSLGMLYACALTRLKHFRQHSTPLHGYIYTRRIFTCSRGSYYSCPCRSPFKRVGPQLIRDFRRDILLLCELNDYEDEVEHTYISLSERDACKM
jgi:hypothetical protein